MAIVSQSEFRANMAKLLDQVEDDSKELIVTRQRGKKTVVIISLDEYESWKETEYLMSTKANRDRIRDAVAALDKGEGIVMSTDELREFVEKQKKDAA